MKKWILLFLLGRVFPLPASSQVSDAEIALLQKLDSVQNSSSVSRYFAGLYFNTTSKAVDFFMNRGETEKIFIQRLETRFAGFFFHSVEDYSHAAAIPLVWKTYFGDSSLSPLQYELLGINAHINGDIWQALVAEFSLEEIQEGRNSYFEFQKGLIKEYRDFYAASLNSSAKTRLLHNASMGLDKIYGQWMLARWRKRQMQLAVLYYTDKEQFNRKLSKLHQKMEHLNRMILHYF